MLFRKITAGPKNRKLSNTIGERELNWKNLLIPFQYSSEELACPRYTSSMLRSQTGMRKVGLRSWITGMVASKKTGLCTLGSKDIEAAFFMAFFNLRRVKRSPPVPDLEVRLSFTEHYRAAVGYCAYRLFHRS